MPTPTTHFNTTIKPHIRYADDLHGRFGPYLPDFKLIDTANVALTLQLPLLLTGKPGCGKTDFAYVAAHALGAGELLECQIRSDVRARDLLYHYDPVLRFTDGQHGTDEQIARSRDARNYVQLRPLGIALMSETRRVVLIDEIDKAPRDLPNDLLRELDRGEFEIPEIRDAPAGSQPVTCEGIPLSRMMKRPDRPMPFVVITSNVERQLPDAFLRRCVFFHIGLPDDERMLDILKAHIQATDATDAPERTSQAPLRTQRLRLEHPLDDAHKRKLVKIFMGVRGMSGLIKPPSTAEFLDWVGALDLFSPNHVRTQIDRFHEALEHTDAQAKRPARERKPSGAELSWFDLPARACLFKLEEDLERARTASVG